MKEIKFRVFDKINKEMYKDVNPFEFIKSEDGFSTKSVTFVQEYYMEAPSDEDIAVMQYTGLKDKNGITYCADDIIKYGDKYYPLIQGTYKFELVGFYRALQDDPTDFFSEEAYLLGEVVGNTYQNPELLESTPPKEE